MEVGLLWGGEGSVTENDLVRKASRTAQRRTSYPDNVMVKHKNIVNEGL